MVEEGCPQKAKDKSLDEEEDDLPADFWDIGQRTEGRGKGGGSVGEGDLVTPKADGSPPSPRSCDPSPWEDSCADLGKSW